MAPDGIASGSGGLVSMAVGPKVQRGSSKTHSAPISADETREQIEPWHFRGGGKLCAGQVQQPSGPPVYCPVSPSLGTGGRLRGTSEPLVSAVLECNSTPLDTHVFLMRM